MHLEFENLIEWGRARRKVKNLRGGFFFNKPSQDELATWQLQMFTADKQSKLESERNLEQLKKKATELEMPVLVVRSNEIQFVGTDMAVAMTDLYDEEWMYQIQDYFEKRNNIFAKPFYSHNETSLGMHAYTMYCYGHDACFARSPQLGFYSVAEDRKITDRREQIQMLWDLGFVARRGRPVGVGSERHSGSPEEVAEITRLANKHWHRRGHSEVADKICSAYTSINRYFAWPGSW